LLTEGLLIAMLSALAGLALAWLLLRLAVFLLVVLLPPTIALRVRLMPLDFDIRVFAFTCGIACVVTIMFALLPALQATRLTLTDALRGQPGGSVRSSTLRNILVTAQVTVSLVLLIVAGTLVRNGTAIQASNLGLDTHDVISVRQNRNDRALVEHAHRELTANPLVEQVVVTSRNPLFGEPPGFLLKGPNGVLRSTYSFVSPEYFAFLRIPLVHGRSFSADEARQEAGVAVVSASGANALWPGEDPIGKTIRLNIEPRVTRLAEIETMHELRKLDDESKPAIVVTVVGIAGDAVNGFVYTGSKESHFYLPTTANGSRADALMVRGRIGTTVESIKSVLLRANADPTIFDVLALDEMVTLQMFPLRAASLIGSLLSVIALALSISGLYGVLTYIFGQRTQEIGIRMALGAGAAAVRRLVFIQSARFAFAGTVFGLLIGYSVMKLLSTVIRLENVSVIDPWAFLISVVLIAAAVAVASYGPARRAVRIDPSSMLRADA
jgi:predicted permease